MFPVGIYLLRVKYVQNYYSKTPRNIVDTFLVSLF